MVSYVQRGWDGGRGEGVERRAGSGSRLLLFRLRGPNMVVWCGVAREFLAWPSVSHNNSNDGKGRSPKADLFRWAAGWKERGGGWGGVD